MAELAFVALGSNLGNRAAALASARHLLDVAPATRLVAASRVEETAPFGPVAQPPYLNQMVALATGLTPEALLEACQRIEHRLGRVRGVRWGARTIDLDIVCMGARRAGSARLALPHPGLRSRAFWRREKAELERLLGAAT